MSITTGVAETRVQNNTSSKIKTLICIPCFNSEDTIIGTTRAALAHSDADILLIDDLSWKPLSELIAREFPNEPRVQIVRPKRKVFAGGGKNIGLRRSLADDYDFVMMMDSDIDLQPGCFSRMVDFLTTTGEVVVGAGILPHGNMLQYAETLINFSKYLPVPGDDVSWKNYLAGYAFMLNLKVFLTAPCAMPNSIGGDDVVFFQRMKEHFSVESFPLLNRAQVIHKPPRCTLTKAINAQRRYARGFYSHAKDTRNDIPNLFPPIHLLTPRFWFMVWRLLFGRRIADLRYAPVCWFLDFRRALGILHLKLTGFQYPKYRPNGDLLSTGSHHQS